MRRSTKTSVFLLVGLTFVAALANATAGEPIKAKGKVSLGFHKVEMKAGQFYVIRVEGKDRTFRPVVVMRPERLPFAMQDLRKPNLFQSHFFADENSTQTITVGCSPFGVNGKGPFEYTLQVTPIALAAKPLLKSNDALTAADPKYKFRKHHKAYKVKLAAGRYYIFDMKEEEKSDLDCYLYLEDPAGKGVAQDDDGGKGLNSRIVIRAKQAGTYRVIATGLGDALGKYSLTVRAQAK